MLASREMLGCLPHLVVTWMEGEKVSGTRDPELAGMKCEQVRECLEAGAGQSGSWECWGADTEGRG